MSVAAEWEHVYSDVEDLLAPALHFDPWERALYYHLLRHTRLKGLTSSLFAVAPLARAVAISDFKVREVLRALHRKGCVRIEERSRNGHLVTVMLPSEMEGLARPPDVEAAVDIESVDFFTGRRHVAPLLAREGGRCFYCLKALTVDTTELDHLIPQAQDLVNSYRNIVTSCHGCNKLKGETVADDFVRRLYRDGVLNGSELQERLAAIAAVQAGERVPELVGRAG